jgi:hypothetical protein
LGPIYRLQALEQCVTEEGEVPANFPKDNTVQYILAVFAAAGQHRLLKKFRRFGG